MKRRFPMSDKKSKKPQKLKARLPRGFADRSAADIRATDEMVAKIRAVFERYGFDPVETPAFEYTDALGKFLPDQDRPNEGVFSLQDDDEQWMSLRYDLTAPLARHVAQNINEIALPYRTYRQGWVFRNEKPGPGRFRQFMQFDADTVGAPGVQADAEMAMMMADTMEALGIKRGDYVIRVNDRRVMDGVLDALDIGDPYKRLGVLRSIDKLDKFGAEGVRQLLGTGRADESGDFTPGVGLTDEQIDAFEPILLASTDRDKVVIAREGLSPDRPDFILVDQQEVRPPKGLPDHIASTGLNSAALGVINATFFRFGGDATALSSSYYGYDALSKMAVLLQECGYDDRIRIDPSVVRGLEYYTGPVYEAELLFDVVNDKGETVQFGSVGGGGRYDGLVKRFTGQDVPATGFSIGVSRMMTALKNLGKLGADAMVELVLVTVMDGDTEALGRYQKMTQDLREAGIRAEMYQGNWKKFGNQLRYADRRGCPVAIIQGSDERERGIVQIKDMIEGRKEAAAIESNEAYRAARPGQFEVAEGDLVAEVTKLLAAQAGG